MTAAVDSAAQTSGLFTAFVVLDDHPIVSKALAGHLAADFPEIPVAYAGTDLEAAAAACSPGMLAVVDLDLGVDATPVEVVARMMASGAEVLIISALAQPLLVAEVLALGARGYVSKRGDAAELNAAVRGVAAGNSWISPIVAGMISGADGGPVVLSPQERRALVLYASGLTLDVVAYRMGVARSTAKEYIDRVRRKYEENGLRARTKTELHITARRQGLIR